MKFTRLAAAAALVLSAGFANAAILPDFTVTPGAYAPGKGPFVADKIVGNYVERISVTGAAFTVSILWNAGNFVKNDGTTTLFGTTTGLGNSYGMYAFFLGSGTIAPITGGSAFTLVTGALNLYLDQTGDTVFTDASLQASTAVWGVVSGGGNDIPLASGSAVSGNGSFNCTGNNNCGSFGQTTTFNLTPTGKTFFTAPDPFYMLSLQSGNFNGFTPAGTQTLDGTLNVIFANVPEPGSIALVGLALVGLGFASRRKAK